MQTVPSVDEKYAKRRAVIRKTWLPAFTKLDSVEHAFVVGRPSRKRDLTDLREEAQQYGGPFLSVDAEVRYIFIL